MMHDPRLSGPWTATMYSDHLPDSIAFDEGLIETLLNFYQPEKSLDLGCGLGYYVKYLRERRIDAWGVEAEDLGELFKVPGYQIRKDLSQLFDLQEKFDLVICLEVVEHIPRDFEEIVFDNIVCHMNKYLLFSGATIGQQGTGHINERPEKHWFWHLAKRGLVLRHPETLNVRLACTLPWYAKNVSIWELIHPDNQDLFTMIAEQDSRILTQETELRKQIQQMQDELDQLQDVLKQKQTEINQAQTEINQAQTEISQAQATLFTFKNSRFWQLHQTWLKTEKAWKVLTNQ